MTTLLIDSIQIQDNLSREIALRIILRIWIFLPPMGCACSNHARRRRSSPPYVKRSSLPQGAANSRRLTGCAADLSSSTIEEEIMKSTNDLRPMQRLWTQKKNNEVVDDAKAPTTPSLTPETINAWELMAGLEDMDHHASSFSSSPEFIMLDEDLIISDLSVDIMSSIRIVLDELPPENPLSSCPSTEPMVTTGIVQSRIDGFHRKMDTQMASNTDMTGTNTDWVAPRCKFPSGWKKKVVLYFTSLRGVRWTYEDCQMVETMLKSYGVRVDERDVSMDGGFREELDDLLGPGNGGGNRLPAVFVDGHYLGGIEEVRQFHDAGELGRVLEGCEMTEPVMKGEVGGDGIVAAACEGCGDVRFAVCPTCSGSRKLYEEEAEEEEEEEELVDGFRRCPDCNENGLVRCPICC